MAKADSTLTIRPALGVAAPLPLQLDIEDILSPDAELLALDRQHAALQAAFDSFAMVDFDADKVGRELEAIANRAIFGIPAKTLAGLAAKARIIIRRGTGCSCGDDAKPLAESVLAVALRVDPARTLPATT